MTDTDKADFNRVGWRSRRGLRELDLLLVPFALEVFPQLDAGQQAAYKRLLERDDPTLLGWMQGGEPAEDMEVAALVERIRDFSRTQDGPA